MSEFPWLDFIRGMLGGPQRKTPSQLSEEAYPTYEDKTRLKLPTEEFLSAPVTPEERGLLGQVPPGMLHQLHKNALDRDLNNMQFWHAVERAKPKSI